MSAAKTLSSSNASEVAGENSESASVAHRSVPSSVSSARTRRSADPMNREPPPAEGAVPAVEFAWMASAGHERSPVASSNAATTTCAVSVFRATATTWASATATAESTRPSISADHVIVPLSSETAYTVPPWSPTNAFVPSIVTPLREVAPSGVRQSSVRSARETATSVETSDCSSGPVGDGLGPVVEGEPPGAALALGLGEPSGAPPASFGPGPSRYTRIRPRGPAPIAGIDSGPPSRATRHSMAPEATSIP